MEYICFSLGGPFPELELTTPDNDQIIHSLIQFLEQRINKRNILRADLTRKREIFGCTQINLVNISIRF